MKIILTKKLIKENHAVKNLNNYVATFDYIDKILIFLSATSSGVWIISLVLVAEAPVRIAAAIFT